MKEVGERQKAGDSRPGRPSEQLTLEDLGISRDQSSQWQKLGDVSDDLFEAHLADRPVGVSSSSSFSPG
jgi:hypothetical protein